jgi:hypothetical protein
MEVHRPSGGADVGKAMDKGGDKSVKRVAQKSIKEKRAAKKAKKGATRSE